MPSKPPTMFNKKSREKSQPRMVKLSYVLTPFAIIFAAIIVLVIVGALAPKPAKKPVEIKAPLVEVQNLAKQQVTFSIQSQGSIVPRTQTNLISEVSGQVIEVSDKFKVGGFFRRGEELLAIDDINYQVALVQAQSRLGTAQANLTEEKARGEQAQEEWLLSGKSLESAPVMALRKPQLKKAQAELKAAKADLKQARVKLSRTKIVAPYDAMLKEKQVDIGQYVSVGSMLATTFAVDYAEARLPIKQRDVAFLELPKINQHNDKGSAVDLSLNVGGQTSHWSSSLARYEGVIDSASRVHYVVAQINDPYAILSNQSQQELRIGSFVNAQITGKTVDNVMVIPRSALHGADTLYMVDSENKLHIEKVTILRSDEQSIYSQDEFNSDLRLVTTQLETPVVGMTLRIDGEQVEETVAAVETDKTKEEQ